MADVIEQHRQVAKDIVISRTSIIQAHQRKGELDRLISTTTDNVMNLEKDTKMFENVIKTATATSKDKAIGDATTYLSIYNNALLHQMEQVFACNMQLMEDEKEDFNITAAVQTKIKSIITPETTKRILDTVSNSEEIKSESQKIIGALVKRQREMEDTFKMKMDRDFKEKSDVIQSKINTMMEGIEMRVNNLSTKINNQIDTLDLRQSILANENNILYK